MRSSRSRANRKARKNNHSSSPATQQQGSENLTSTTRRSFQRCRFFGIGGALILAIGLATAIASPAQTFNVLASFDVTDGAYTVTGLTQGRDGNLYRTTTRGGANNSGCYYTPDCGTIIKITPGGKLPRFTTSAPKLTALTAATRKPVWLMPSMGTSTGQQTPAGPTTQAASLGKRSAAARSSKSLQTAR